MNDKTINHRGTEKDKIFPGSCSWSSTNDAGETPALPVFFEKEPWSAGVPPAMRAVGSPTATPFPMFFSVSLCLMVFGDLAQINLMMIIYLPRHCEERSDMTIHEAVWIATGLRPSP
jgi:hypothetical protein